jgi:HemY protein
VVAAVGCAFAERQLWGKARRLLEQAAARPACRPCCAAAPGASWRRWRAKKADDVRAAAANTLPPQLD